MNDNNKKNNKNVLRTHDDVIYFPVFSLLQLSGVGGEHIPLPAFWLFVFIYGYEKKNLKEELTSNAICIISKFQETLLKLK